jgi:uncharacterized RDD family membrane protein YckC
MPPPPHFNPVPPEAQSTAINASVHPEHEESVRYAPGPLKNFLPPIPDNAEPIMNGDQPERGDFATRLVAFLIDVVPIVVLGILSWIAPSILFLIHPALAGGCGCLLGILSFVLSLGLLILWPWCWITFGATPGKTIMKLRVVPENDPKGRIDVNMAIMRLIGHFINGVILGLPYLMILGEDRKGLQDILSKSIVIKVDR